MAFDVEAARAQFPVLSRQVHGKPLVYLDSGASAQKPLAVIEAMTRLMSESYANVHRGLHTLANETTDAYEAARCTVADFLGAADPAEIVFVRGATEAINLVAHTWGVACLRAGDEIVISHLEHHANIVPWQLLAHRTGAVLRVAPVDDRGELVFDEYLALLGPRTKLVAMTQVSNALGTVTPIPAVIAAARSSN